MRRFTWVPFAVALFAFVLPFATVSCGELHVKPNGADLVVRTPPETEGSNPEGIDLGALVVAHGGSIRAVHAAALGVDVHTYRRIQRVEPNATLSAVCVEDGQLTELCRTEDLDEFLVEEQRRRREAAARPPTPAG